MSFIVETGSGTPNATSYVTPAFVTAYLTDRGRETENGWSTAAAPLQEDACIASTSYIDFSKGNRFRGSKLNLAIVGRQSYGEIAFGGLPTDAETITIGQKVYRFVAALAQENDVLIGASAAATATNLIAAIQGNTEQLEVTVGKYTQLNYDVVASIDPDDDTNILLTAQTPGANGDTVALESVATNVTLINSAGDTLTGGNDEGAQPLEFPRQSLYERSGVLVQGIPLKLRQSAAEYAVRSLAAVLAPDPVASDTGAVVQRARNVLGPMTEDITYVEGATPALFQSYPAADALLRGYMRPVGVIR